MRVVRIHTRLRRQMTLFHAIHGCAMFSLCVFCQKDWKNERRQTDAEADRDSEMDGRTRTDNDNDGENNGQLEQN